MAKFRIDNLAALARQLSFTPNDTRALQLNAAEELLHSIDPGKAYPLDFVIFKITGYHPRATRVGEQLAGIALQHDLGLLIEQVSQTLDLHTSLIAEPVLDIDDVTERFNVTSKTIQRWRRKGLPARRFVFGDGKRRVGFFLSSVERFFASHQDQVSRGTNFSQVADAEREDILRRARRLATMCHCCVNEISRRIARKLNRSPATILHTIRKYDAENPAAAIFAHAAAPIADEERVRIVRLFRRGVAIKTLAKRSCRPRSAIYRLVVEEKVAKLNKRKVKFIDDPLYHQTDAEEIVDALAKARATIEGSASADEGQALRVPRDVPTSLASICSAPLLTPARERALFLKLNFHKMRFVTARRKLEPDFARARDLNLLESHLRKAAETKNEIVRANMRLVVSIARKHLRPSLALMELVSDGTMTLMRAIDSFDVHRGHKFSTYATLALMKGFARSVPQMLANRARGTSQETETTMVEVADRRTPVAAERFLVREEVTHLLRQLDARERDVLRGHFGLDDGAAATYEQLGERLGLSKERVRQIEQAALAKLRGGGAGMIIRR